MSKPKQCDECGCTKFIEKLNNWVCSNCRKCWGK